MNEALEQKLKTLPKKPGVYLMKDIVGTIIYVGKAKVLKNRVSSYFIAPSSKDIKTKTMVSKVADLDYILTSSEAEALILECNLIKRHQPFYNILLKDDKSYPYIELTSELYPAVRLTRSIQNRKNKYFGPFANAFAAKQVTEAINKLYLTKKCTKALQLGVRKGTYCIQYHINACPGYCDGKDRTAQYGKLIEKIKTILEGDIKTLVADLTEEMLSASEKENFEHAQECKTYIAYAKALFERSYMENADGLNGDYVACYSENNLAYGFILHMRAGKIIDKTSLTLQNADNAQTSQLLYTILTQYYSNIADIPREIYIAEDFAQLHDAALFLSTLANRTIHVNVPQKGRHKRLVELARDNAKQNCLMKKTREQQKQEQQEKALEEIREFVHASKLTRIEAYDISNIAGTLSGAGMVVYTQGKKDKKAYRKFRIKTVEGANDLASIAETLMRRFENAKRELESNEQTPRFLPLPDVVMVDGGQAHACIAKDIIKAYGYDIAVCGMVKNQKHTLRALVLPDGTEKALQTFPYAKHLLYSINEEVHRFALDYHKTMHKKHTFASTLTQIDGVGEASAKALLKHFKSMENIKNASVEELLQTPRLTKSAAQNIFTHFNKNLS